MATINAQGLCQISSGALARGNLDLGRGGLSEIATEALARGNRVIGAKGLAEFQVVALGHLVKLVEVSTIVAISSTRVRITFDRPMKKDAALLAAFNYSIVPITAGAVTIVINEIEPENTAQPEFVDAITSEMTDGATYEGAVSATGPTDVGGTPVDPANNDAQFTGIGDAPTVSQVISQGENRADVVYSETMRDTPGIRDPARYTWDNGLTTLSVLELDGATVKLVTGDQAEGVLYTLTITP